jgi:hypothetical protein
MEFQLHKKENEYRVGDYYCNLNTDEVLRIIYDNDRGLALLNVETGYIESEFQESMDDFVKYTRISEYAEVKQMSRVEFKVI